MFRPPQISSATTFLSFFSKTIQINIIDDEEYEKNKNFFMELSEPRLVEMSERKGGDILLSCCGPAPTTINLYSELIWTQRC